MLNADEHKLISDAPRPPWLDFARAPLIPAAVASLIGLLVDRTMTVAPLPLIVLAIVAAIIAVVWKASARVAFAVSIFGLAAAHHHEHRHRFAADDIGEFATAEVRLATIRGVIDEVPVVRPARTSEFSGPLHRHDRGFTVIAVTAIATESGWAPVSGRMVLVIERIIDATRQAGLERLNIGDAIEVVGLMSRPQSPRNPGEKDYAKYQQDRRIRAELRVTKGADTITRLDDAASWSMARELARLRRHLTAAIHETMTGTDAALARALILGDGTTTERDDWDAFARTGVIHVLVISGQHLVILAGAVSFILSTLGLRRRTVAVAVIAFVVLYAMMTGGQPSAVRAAVMVSAYSFATMLNRPGNTANALALAWLVLVAIDPTAVLSAGSQLSFLSVIVIVWGCPRWFAPPPPTAIEILIDESRPLWLRFLRRIGAAIALAYAVNAAVTLANMPLLAYHNHVVPLASFVIGPPVILLTTMALLTGFMMLPIAVLHPILAWPFASTTAFLLDFTREIVHFTNPLRLSSLFVPDVAAVWVIIVTGLLIAWVITTDRRVMIALLAAALVVPLTVPSRDCDELRITVLAVGHGGCIVIEPPDGRVIVYDCGTMAGPETVRRSIAPFLWQRGIGRVDEVIISHADLDHYGCLPELLARFRVGMITLTPSFADKATPEVAALLHVLEEQQVPRRIAMAGEVFTAGDVTLEVLHPPAEGPAGVENVRSLVIALTHGSHSFLLTGDLEKSGTAYLLNQPPRRFAAMMAPHHGAKAAFPAALAQWADPGLVIVSRGARGSAIDALSHHTVWDTHSFGAITLRSHATGFVAESFVTGEQRVLMRGP
jgi:competence protein ComEC